jgi:hypothetical protein
VIYQYTGNPFTAVVAPYTTSDFVSVSLTLAQPLSAGFSGSPEIMNLTMSDGVQTLTSSSNTNDCPQTMCFELLVGGGGKIIGWSIFLGTYFSGGDGSISTVYGVPVQLFADSAGFGFSGGSGSNSNSPGTWVEIVPEPSTLALSVLPVAFIVAAARKRRSA